jgi:hypothetical protein
MTNNKKLKGNPQDTDTEFADDFHSEGQQKGRNNDHPNRRKRRNEPKYARKNN